MSGSEAARGRELRQSLSGLEFFQQMIAGTIPPPPLVALLGFRIVEAAFGHVVFAGVPAEAYYNGMGVVHGGYAATLLDSALGCAVNSSMPAGRSFTTVDLAIKYLRPLDVDVGPIRCDARVIHAGNRVATAEGRIVDAKDRMYAHGTTTCVLVGEK